MKGHLFALGRTSGQEVLFRLSPVRLQLGSVRIPGRAAAWRMALREIPAAQVEPGQEHHRSVEQPAFAERRQVHHHRPGSGHVQLGGVPQKAKAGTRLPPIRVPTLQAAKARGGVLGRQRPGYGQSRRQDRHSSQDRARGNVRISQVRGEDLRGHLQPDRRPAVRQLSIDTGEPPPPVKDGPTCQGRWDGLVQKVDADEEIVD